MNRILLGNSNKEVISSDKLIINLEEDKNILLENKDYKDVEINVKNAKINVLVLNECSKDINYEININQGDVYFNDVSYNSGNVKINAKLMNESSSINIYNSVIASKKVRYDIDVKHQSKNTYSDIQNNGVTKKDGAICFNVTSFVPKKSTGCKVNQDSKIITLNETNENEINPILLIDEFDSEARHAAFIGNFKENELFYLMSRGLIKKDAMNLLISGMLIGTLKLCFDEKEKLKEKLEKEWR